MFPMNYSNLSKLRKQLYFTTRDVATIFNIKLASAQVLCSRYTAKGIFIRLKNNFYVLEQKWDKFVNEEFFKISNYLQVPSYISFMSALSFYEITTQVLRGFYESACLKRTVNFSKSEVCFNFYKLNKRYYFDFEKKHDYFIATKEKAFVDSVYLYSLGKYRIDFSSLNVAGLNKDKISEIIKVFPQKTICEVKKLCKI